MSDYQNVYGSTRQNTATVERNILKNVYVWMTGGLALTAIMGYFIAQSGLLRQIDPMFIMIAVFAELGLVLFLSARIMKMSVTAAVTSFIAYAALNGLTLSLIFSIFELGSIATVFFITAGTFSAMSLYGYTTKTDLSKIGNYLFMALIGIIIASVVNWFMQSEMLYYLISYIGVAVFVGLTAYDTQKIKQMSRQYSSQVDEAGYVKLSIMGALKLYLDFLNLFLFLLRIFGNRR